MVASFSSQLQDNFREYIPLILRESIGTVRRTSREWKSNIEFLRRNLPQVSPSTDSSQHIVCIVVDALRADALNPNSTPFLSSLEGTTAVAPAPWTFPSVSSILTGRYPHNHRAMRQSAQPDNATEAEITIPPKLPDNMTTLPEYFGGAGYDTFGAFAFAMPFLAAKGRFRHHSLSVGASASQVIDSYLDWLNNREDHHTFAYLHLADLHQPVNPPDQYWLEYDIDSNIPDIRDWNYTSEWDAPDAEEYQRNRKSLYRAALAFVDDELAKLAETLARRLPDSRFIVTADHGEAFWEHAAFDAEHFYDSRPAYCVGHGGTPYESITQVPLLDSCGGFGNGPTSLVDLTPTLLNDLGVDVPKTMDGHTYRSDIPTDRILLTESTRYGYEKKAVYFGNQKLIVSPGDDEEVAFELPDEDIIDLSSEVKSKLHDALPEWPSGGKQRRVASDVRQQLEDLGYR